MAKPSRSLSGGAAIYRASLFGLERPGPRVTRFPGPRPRVEGTRRDERRLLRAGSPQRVHLNPRRSPSRVDPTVEEHVGAAGGPAPQGGARTLMAHAYGIDAAGDSLVAGAVARAKAVAAAHAADVDE